MRFKRLNWQLILAAALAMLNGGYMVFDGLRRVVTGDYVRIEGQLGPWAGLAELIGIDPMSMWPVFLVLGLVQLGCAAALLSRYKWAFWGTLLLAVLTTWYLVFGTLTSIVQIILLTRARKHSQLSAAHEYR